MIFLFIGSSPHWLGRMAVNRAAALKHRCTYVLTTRYASVDKSCAMIILNFDIHRPQENQSEKQKLKHQVSEFYNDQKDLLCGQLGDPNCNILLYG